MTGERNKVLFQSRFWGYFKKQQGHSIDIFSPSAYLRPGPHLLVIYRNFTNTTTYGYVPYGPEISKPNEEQGLLLEELAEELRPQLPEGCVFLRFDLPWKNPFLPDGEPAVKKNHAWSVPEPRIREMRMNFGSRTWNLLKAPTDMQPTNTTVLDLKQSEEMLLRGMKPKTRYNIRLGKRKGVKVTATDTPDISDWYRLYRETTERKGIICEKLSYFKNLFILSENFKPRFYLLEAWNGNNLISGIIISIYGQRAYYLYGASAYQYRSLMGPHVLQWEAIRLAKNMGCRSYDLFGIPLKNDPSHPMFGLYRFKTGFGGKIFHWRGCWDYPYLPDIYKRNILNTAVMNSYHTGST